MKDGIQLAKAIQIAATAFEDITDKQGVPYILHCLTVMERVGKITQKNSTAMQVAVMHDLIEDTPWTDRMLEAEGFSQHCISGVTRMTHVNGEPYEDYIMRVGGSKMCTIIKMCDLKHNSDITRMQGVTDKDTDRLAKYCKAYNYLDDLMKTVHV